MSSTTAEAKSPFKAPARSRGTFDNALNLMELIGVFRRRFKLFAAVAVTVTVACLVATLVISPQYTASASVKIDTSGRSFVDAEKTGNTDQMAGTLVDTELRIAQSRDVISAVVDRLKLMDDPEFAPKPKDRASMSQPAIRTSVIDAVSKRLDAKRDSLTYVVNFGFTSDDPQKAAAIANAFADEYMKASVRLRMEGIQAQAQALSSGIGKLGEEAKAADAAAAAFRAQHGLVNAMGEGTVTQQQASSLAMGLSGAQSDLAGARSALAQAESQLRTGGIDAVYNVLNSPVIQDLRHQRAEVGREQADIASKYGPKHPEYLKVQQQADSLDRQIREEGQRIIAGLRANATAAQARVNALQGTLSGLQGQLAGSNRAEAIAQGLDKDALAKRDIYNQFLTAQQNANQQKNMNAPQAVVVSQAVAPLKPSFPNKPLFGLLGAFLGVVLGSGAVFVAETMDSGLANSKDAEEALGLPVMASVPALSPRVLRSAGRHTSPDTYVMSKPMSAYAEAFRSIRSALVLSNVDSSVKVVAITSALPAEGKTASAITFARVLGMGGSKVCLVDCDLRRGSIARHSGAEIKTGLVEVLSGASSLEESLIKDDVDGVWMLPLAHASFTPRDLFGSDAIRRLLKDLGERFDFVILDTPPVLAVTDARLLACLADAVVFICRWAKTPRGAAASAVSILERDGANIAGVALTMVDYSAKGAISAYDPSYYHDSYRRYYQG